MDKRKQLQFKFAVKRMMQEIKADEERASKSPYERYLDSIKIKLTSWLIVDHSNYADAVQNQLADYYVNYPTEASQDGETWPAFTPSAFPWLVVNHEFTGEETVLVYYKGELVYTYKPQATVEQESGNTVPRTYAIYSLPNDFNLIDFAETAEGNQTKANSKDFEVFLATGYKTEQEWESEQGE